MSALKSLAALSIASMSILPLSTEVKADDYEKGFYGSIGAGAGTFSDLLLVGTPFALAFDAGFSYEGTSYNIADIIKYMENKINGKKTNIEIQSQL